MRHAFRIPAHIREAVRKHVETAVVRTNPQRFRQEQKYTSSLITRLEGTPYEDDDGFVKFSATDFDDRGRGAAESRFGADFGITAEISDGSITIRKAILVQAKLGTIAELDADERQRLLGQIEDMKRVVNAPKVMELPMLEDRRDPRVISGNRILDGLPYRSMRLADYVVARITTTLDGTTDQDIVDGIGSSNLRKLDLLARFNRRE